MEDRCGQVAAKTGGARGLMAGLGRILFPHFCVGCGREGEILCRGCQEEISAPLKGVFSCPGCGRATPLGLACSEACRRRSGLDGAAAMAPYGHPALRQLLRAYKYEGVAEAGAALAAIFGAFLQRQRAVFGPAAAGAAVVPVPLHFFRLARRGFNQADLFAEALARTCGRPVAGRLLRRRFRFAAQASLASPERRRLNARGSVELRPGASVPGACVLVDDVFTTGSTAADCARVLRAAGTSRVWIVTLLRGQRS